MAKWTDRSFNSADGLRLHYRDYDGPHDQPPILCLPGLTRNARDFEPVADRFAGDWRILMLEFRGRGMSEYDPDPANYRPTTYAADVRKMLDQLGIADAVFFGTSLGGIVTMLLASTDSERIAGTLLNDVGPEVGTVGIDRIATYVGKDVIFSSWDEAAVQLRERNVELFPRWVEEDWDRFARRICREEGNQVRFDSDMKIADNFRLAAETPAIDAWPAYRALGGRPVTILRGELSELLTQETAEKMAGQLPDDAELVIVPDVGHTPNLEEPESVAAMTRLLDRVLASQT
jgi:pimeloyl-ACP methyl ester carboxylesterase